MPVYREGNAMELAEKHGICLNERKNGIVTGVKKVLCFGMNEAELNTELGKLTIKGEDLHMEKYDSDTGELEFKGQVVSIAYSEIMDPGKTASKIFGRLFK